MQRGQRPLYKIGYRSITNVLSAYLEQWLVDNKALGIGAGVDV